MSLRLSRKWCFKIIKVRMVEGRRLARRKEIVSRPPEKMRSTATADPSMTRQFRLQNESRRRKTHRELREHHKQAYKHLGIGRDDLPTTWLGHIN